MPHVIALVDDLMVLRRTGVAAKGAAAMAAAAEARRPLEEHAP